MVVLVLPRALKTEHDTTVSHHVELSKSFASMIEVLDTLRAEHEELQAVHAASRRDRGRAMEQVVQLKVRVHRPTSTSKRIHVWMTLCPCHV